MVNDLRMSARSIATISDIYSSNAQLARTETEAQAWLTASLRLLDAHDALTAAADAIEGVWQPVADERQTEAAL